MVLPGDVKCSVILTGLRVNVTDEQTDELNDDDMRRACINVSRNNNVVSRSFVTFFICIEVVSEVSLLLSAHSLRMCFCVTGVIKTITLKSSDFGHAK